MKAYEDWLYEQWRENVQVVLPVLLKHNLLVKPEEKLQLGLEDANKDDTQDAETGGLPWQYLVTKMNLFRRSYM